MESYCSLYTFKVPQWAKILCTLDTIHRLFFVTRVIINKINKVQWHYTLEKMYKWLKIELSFFIIMIVLLRI
jgi:hypothetical protein